jgi:hypothetical protein
MTGYTRSGKIVGSYKAPANDWCYWPESNWQTGEKGFITVAPSGARIDWFATEAEAKAYVAEKNASL